MSTQTGQQIEEVPNLSWEKSGDCTFAGALAAALAATEHPLRRPVIMGWSGLAFRVRWYQGKEGPRWCPSNPVGEFPEEIEALRKATGWELPVVAHMGEEHPDMAQYAPRIVESLEAGKPVLTYDKSLNMGVVVGFRDGGQKLLFNGYDTGEEPDEISPSDLGPMLIFLGEHGESGESRENTVRALRMGLENWGREPLKSERGMYLYGKAAYVEWADDLAASSSLSEEEQRTLFFASWWNFANLYEARRSAMRFLYMSSRRSEPPATYTLMRTANKYGEAAELLGWHKSVEKRTFLGPWSQKGFEDWSTQIRMREAGVLRDAMRLEEEAIEQMAKSLNMMGRHD